MFRLAHISDVHLSPLPRVAAGDLLFNKRIIGFLSWTLRRRGIHKPHVLDKLIADLQQCSPDHIAFTGDLANISLPAEFDRGGAWLARLGDSQQVSFVPGNHDTYIDVDWATGLGKWQAYMKSDLQLPVPQQERFPYVRQRRNIALIGLSSAVPAALHRASGTVSQEQLDTTARVLKMLRERGFYRVVMIHHPPLPGQARPRKALTNAAALREILEAEGAELVLHGHNHMDMHEVLETRHGPAHVIGVPSTSALAHKSKPAAAWHLYSISRRNQNWQLLVEKHKYDSARDTIVPETAFKLDYC
jgi:3',5'-cyclic AMP phosphodiesterase CpdA